MLNSQKKAELDALCHKFRTEVIDVLYEIKTGHPGGSLSVCEILTALYFGKANITTGNQDSPDRDRVVLCKGHAAPMLYRVLAEKGFFPISEMKTLRQINSRLQGHPCSNHIPGVELSTGPLGIGLSASLGMALANRLYGYDNSYVYAILGDGELNEGTVWEAAMAAYKFKADHLIAILDFNKVQLDGTAEQIMPMGDIAAKWNSFGWKVIECDGHNLSSICDAIDEAKKSFGLPVIILAKTVKGKGISFMEGKNTWHGKPISDDEYKAAKAELGGAC